MPPASMCPARASASINPRDEHIPRRSIRLQPVPRLAQPLGKPPPALLRVRSDQLANEADIGRGDRSAAERKHGFHDRER